MKILITGVAGFIGSHLAEKLLELGNEVIGIDNFDPYYDRSIKENNIANYSNNSNFTFIEGDICEIDNLLKAVKGIDLIIHLAAKVSVLPSLKNPQAYIKANIEGTQAVLEFMRKKNIGKIIFASSSSIYGNNLKVPFSETDRVDNPISPYAYTKKAGELMLSTYHHLYKINAICFRFFTVYGPRQRPDLAIHKFVQLMEKEEAITMYGDGSSARDYTYISDIIDGLVAGIDYLGKNKKVYEIINLGSNSPITLKNMIQTLYKMVGTKQKVQKLAKQEGDMNKTFADISKAKELLGFQPKVSFEEGAANFVDWYMAKIGLKMQD